MKSVVIIGYMCVGKTTVGRNLALRMGRRFYDLDWYIEERFHSRVSQIFSEKGEPVFRDLERRMLREVAAFEDIVLSCGGGTPCFADNMDYILGNSLAVYLRATPEIITTHIKYSRLERPLLKGLSGSELDEFVRSQLREREPYYLRAPIIYDIPLLRDRHKVETVANDLQTLITDYWNGKMEN